ncbi:kinase-like protein [Fistulina hepatica ATCC 64428]|nr:kinase-like protein [Fistulina hepatica ATCC 64428]
MADEEDSDGTALPPEKGPEPEVIDLTLDCDSENEEVDLGSATCRSLVRLRRAQLVELCAKRGLDVQGTKPQLADALIVWRDEHGHDSDADDIRGHWRSQRREFSSSSSQGTVRPPSTTTPTKRTRHRRMTNDAESLPVLLRSHHVHMDEPLTPLVNDAQKSRKSSGRKADAEPAELELDLESLGLEDREIPPDKLQKREKIGSGGFKDVFIGKLKGRKIAIAEFRGPLSDMDIKELKLLGGFNHPNIVKFLGVSIPENRRDTPVMMISELCSNGDLFDYVRNVDSPSLYRVLHMMLDIASGLEYLHLCKPSVIHRDCKSSNILITAKGVAKIADFGLAKVKQSTRSMVRSLVGTVNWQAPELWHAHPKYDYKVDVFSCGMVYWEMLQWCLSKEERKYPWEGMNEHAIYEEVGQKLNRPSTNGLRKAWCPEIVDLMETMWAQDPRDRPTMSQVVITVRELVQHHRRR